LVPVEFDVMICLGAKAKASAADEGPEVIQRWPGTSTGGRRREILWGRLRVVGTPYQPTFGAHDAGRERLDGLLSLSRGDLLTTLFRLSRLPRAVEAPHAAAGHLSPRCV
jgi:hypothetical protein